MAIPTISPPPAVTSSAESTLTLPLRVLHLTEADLIDLDPPTSEARGAQDDHTHTGAGESDCDEPDTADSGTNTDSEQSQCAGSDEIDPETLSSAPEITSTLPLRILHLTEADIIDDDAAMAILEPRIAEDELINSVRGGP